MSHHLKQWNFITKEHDLIPCTVHKRDQHRPLCKKGQHIGSWTNKFHKDMSYISFISKVGVHHRVWVKTCRLSGSPDNP